MYIVIKFQKSFALSYNFPRSTASEVGDIHTWDFARPGMIQAIGIMSFGKIFLFLSLTENRY
jgi:hypothetical protein